MIRTRFNRAYYNRFYEQDTSYLTDVRRHGYKVFSTATYLLGRFPTFTLDIGAGWGYWKQVWEEYQREVMHIPEERFEGYLGVEVSEDAVKRHGWLCADVAGSMLSVVSASSELVLCLDVFPYLDYEAVQRASRNLAVCTGKLLYFSAVTQEDKERDGVVKKYTDGSQHFRPWAFYAGELLSAGLSSLGLGWWVNTAWWRKENPAWASEEIPPVLEP